MVISEQAQEILDELYKVNPENLNDKARRLFDTVIEIADERDLYKERINKAIEYIEKHTHNIYANVYRDKDTGMLLSKEKTPIVNRVFQRNPKELLDILQGNDN